MEKNQQVEKGQVAFKMTGNWGNQSNHLKEKFAQLTDADLKCEAGKENEMLARVEKRLNKKRDEVINIINKSNTEKV